MHQSVLIEDLAVVLCIAAIVTVLFQKIKQPTVLGYLIAGMIVGPYTPPFSWIDDETEIRILAELGVIFLMFSLGLEFTFNKVKRLGLPAIIIGVFEVVVMMLIGFLAGEWLGWSPFESLLLGAALSISSTTIIIKALEEFKLKRLFFAELIVGVLLIEDLLAILLLVFVSSAGGDSSVLSTHILMTSIKLLLVITSWFLAGYFILPYMMRKIQKDINHETLTIISVGLCLFLSSVAVYFHYSAALGAFIMGAILAETPIAHKIETLTLPIRDIFAAVFFVSVGMLIDPRAILEYWPPILMLSLITIFGKILASGIGALLAGQGISDSVRIGFSMAQIGEFSFIIIGLGSVLGTTEGSLYPIVVAISAITTFTTPYLIRWGMKISHHVEGSLPKAFQNVLIAYRKAVNRRFETRNNGVKTRHAIRFIINAIIIAILASVSANIIIPKLLPIVNNEWLYQFLFWSIVVLISSPFIWAMLFSQHPAHTNSAKASKGIAWFITLAELGGLGLLYLTFPVLLIPLALLLVVFCMLFFHSLKKGYAFLESHLIYNLTRSYEIDPQVLQELAPWDTELERVRVTVQFPLIGQRLEECNLRPSFGINVVAIKRALRTLWLPNAEERILPEDELVILGDKDQIDNFRKFALTDEEESSAATEEPEVHIQTLRLEHHHPLVGRTISDPMIKDYIRGLIVGLDRQGEHILNPPSYTLLQKGDILLFIMKFEEHRRDNPIA
jgi:monovalent cation:H+ antiporter-2, CPA2 family